MTALLIALALLFALGCDCVVAAVAQAEGEDDETGEQ